MRNATAKIYQLKPYFKSNMQNSSVHLLNLKTSQTDSFSTILQINAARKVDELYDFMLTFKQHLDSCTPNAQTEPFVPKGDERMAHSKRIRVITGYDTNGKTTYVQVSGKTQNELNDAIVRAYVNSGRIWEFMPMPVAAPAPAVPHRNKTRFDIYANDWFETYVRPTVQLGRERSLRSIVKSCVDALGTSFIEDITVKDIAKVMENWGKKYAYNTVDNRRTTLKRIFESAVSDDIIRLNPVSDSRIKNTSARKVATTCLSVEQVSDILSNLPKLATLQQQLIIALYLFTGVRREELLGLKWEDIDLGQKKLHIQRATVYYKGTIVKDPKTVQGDRFIPLCKTLHDLLIRHDRRTGYLISEDGNAPLPLRQYEKEMDDIRSTINLYGAHSREFRRTFASLKLAAGVPLPVVQSNMGHTKPNMTLQAYAKVEKHSWEDSREAISDLISSHNSTKTAS